MISFQPFFEPHFLRTQQFGDPNADQIGDDNSNSSASRRRLPDDDDDMDDDDDENDAHSTNLPLNLVATQFAEWDNQNAETNCCCWIHLKRKKKTKQNKTKETKVFTDSPKQPFFVLFKFIANLSFSVSVHEKETKTQIQFLIYFIFLRMETSLGTYNLPKN